MKIGNWYRFKENDGSIHTGQYMGRQNGFECCVCGKGTNAYTFNIWYDETNYETWGYGKEHMPEIMENLGERADIIVD